MNQLSKNLIRVICTAAWMLSSCSGSYDRQEYIRWVKDYEHGLHVKKEEGDFVFDLQYQPTEYVALQRLSEHPDKEEFEKIKKEIEGLQYYTLTIEVKDPQLDFINYRVSEASEKQRKLYYFSYLFQDNITLSEDSSGPLPCVLYHFEKTVDLRNSRTFVLGFEKPEKDSKKSILTIQSEWLGSLPVKIEINKEPIPALDL